MSHSKIIEATRAQIYNLCTAQKLKLKRGNTSIDAIKFSNLTVVEKYCYFQAMCWQRSPIHWVKLNADGLAKAIQVKLDLRVLFVTLIVILFCFCYVFGLPLFYLYGS